MPSWQSLVYLHRHLPCVLHGVDVCRLEAPSQRSEEPQAIRLQQAAPVPDAARRRSEECGSSKEAAIRLLNPLRYVASAGSYVSWPPVSYEHHNYELIGAWVLCQHVFCGMAGEHADVWLMASRDGRRRSDTRDSLPRSTSGRSPTNLQPCSMFALSEKRGLQPATVCTRRA